MEPFIPASEDVVDVLRGTWYFRVNSSRDVIEVDAMIVPSRMWPEREEATDPSWRPMDFGELTLAVKVLC